MRIRRWWLAAALAVMMSWAAYAQGTDEAIAKLKDLDPSERQMAVAALCYGEPSARVLKALVEAATSDPDATVASSAIEAVGTLGQSAGDKKPYVQALLGMMDSKDKSVQLSAAAALEPLGDPATQARRIALYKAALDDEELRAQGLLGLTRHSGPESMEVLSQLIQVVPAPEDALMAIYMKPGSKGENICAARLAKGLEAGPGEDFDTCLNMALRISEKKDVLVPVLGKLVETLPVMGQRIDAALVLYRWEPGEKTMAPVLKLLDEPDGMTGENLSKVVSELAEQDYKYIRVPLLKALPSVKDETVLSLIMDALAVPGPQEGEALTGMLAHKADESALVRAKVAKSAASLGVSSSKAVPVLKELMKDPELEVAVIAATSYYKLTADKVPVVEVFKRVAKSDVGAEILYTNIESEVAYPLSDELFDILAPMVKAGDPTAKQVMPPLLDHLSPDRLADALAIYPLLDTDSRTMFLSTLSSVHIARPGVEELLRKLSTSKEPDEAYQAAQLLYEKAGDPEPILLLAGRDLRSGKSEQILQAVNYVAYEPRLANELLPDLQTALTALDSDDARAQVLLGIMQTNGRPQALEFLLKALRAGNYEILSQFYYDDEMAADMAPMLNKADVQKLVDFLRTYSKDMRVWEAQLTQAAFCCMLIKEAGAGQQAREVLLDLAAHHSSDTLRTYALEAAGESQ